MADFGSALWNKPAAAGSTPDPVTRSLRFDGSTSKLTRTPSSASSATACTISFWVKRGKTDEENTVFHAGTASGDRGHVRFNSNNTLEAACYNGSWFVELKTNAVYRDPSAFYHIFVSIDTTNGTGKLFVNGEEPSLQTNTTTSSSTVLPFGKTIEHQIGQRGFNSTGYHDGLLADFYFIDGTALSTPVGNPIEDTGYSSYKPKAFNMSSYSGNSFHLKFEDNSDIGSDSTSNSNDWSTTGISSHDVLLDTPTSNFCTFSPISGPPRGTSTTISEGNLKVVGGYSGTYFPRVMGTVAVSSGKWFYEVRCGSNHTNSREYGFKGVNTHWPTGGYGLAGGSTSWATESEFAFSAYQSGVKFSNSSSPATSGTSWGSDGDVIGLALDLDSSPRTLRVFKDGSEVGSATDIPTGGSTEWLPCIDETSYGPQTSVANFGQDPTFGGLESGTTYTSDNTTGVVGEFHNPIPSGYLPFAAGNLDAPAITPAQNFDILTYTGNSDLSNSSGSTQNVTGVNFDVGMAWIKDRDNSSSGLTGNEYGHYLFDTVTGTSTGGYNIDGDVVSSGSGPYLNSGYSGVNSFSAGSGTSRGITVDQAGETNFYYDDGYGSTYTERYVAWLWKLGSTGSSSTWNSSYTAPNTEHYNALAGVTTIDVTPVSSGNLEVAHSLSVAPEFFFVGTDSYASFSGYPAFHKDLDSGKYLQLHENSAQSSDSTYFPSGAAHADYIKLGSIFSDSIYAGNNLRIWAFTGVEGFSKAFKLDTSSDAFCYLGFRPAWVILKRKDGTGDWLIFDDKREGYNVDNDALFAHSSTSESSTDYLDLLSNGFKVRSSNSSIGSGDLVGFAVASSPLKHANAR